jgi:hypothetical protein
MTYKVNYRDIEFNLFEYLKIQELGKSSKYNGLGKEDFSAILSEALKFTQNEIDPLFKKSDEIGCRLENGVVHTPPGFKDAYKHFTANGFIGMDVPTTYGGQGLPVSLAMACQEFFSGSCVAFSMYPGLSRGAAHLIETFSKQELAERFVPKIYSGEWAGTMCLTEPQAGSAVGDLSTTAVSEGDHYKIKGNKIFISSGDHDLTDNIIHMVLARVEGDPAGTKGISLFIVPKIRVNQDGSLGQPNDVKTVNIEHKMGIKGSSTCTLSFGDNNECIGYLIGEQKRGMPMMFQMMNEARLACGLQGQSVAATAYENALDYAKQRVQGGKTLIIEFPDVRRMLLTMKSYAEGMRALIHYTSYLDDQEVVEIDPIKKEKLSGRLGILTPICKAYCTDMGFRVTELAMQTYGGYGYISEYPVEQYMRDIKISSIYEGTNGIQALDLIGRKIGQKNGEYFKEFYEELGTFCKTHEGKPVFSKEAENLKKANDQLAQITMKFAEWMMGGNLALPQLHAVSYLYNFGDVLVAYLLLDQAVLALKKLEEIWKSQGADIEEKKAKICTENEEARFYESKVKSARFFVAQLLPQTLARAKAILSEDLSALKIRF